MDSFVDELAQFEKSIGYVVKHATHFVARRQQEEKDIKSKCNVCKESSKKLLVCSRCKKVAYCCLRDQKKDWKRHKAFCGKSRDLSSVESPSFQFEKGKVEEAEVRDALDKCPVFSWNERKNLYRLLFDILSEKSRTVFNQQECIRTFNRFNAMMGNLGEKDEGKC